MRDGTEVDQIRALITSLREADWSKYSIDERWIGYLFHITSLENALSILTRGQLLSRAKAIETNALERDGAAKIVIEQTHSLVRDCARLYFRPRVPTFYHNEGFISEHELQTSRYKAHIPVPIAFIFDLPSILALPNCQFSDGNMGSKSAKLMGTFTEFKLLPFEQIYSIGAMSGDDRDELRLRRHAEVLIPKQLDLSPHLVRIACRSEAELKTLKHLITEASNGKVLRERYDRRMIVSTNGSVFEAKRPFIQSVRQLGTSVSIDLNATTSRALSYRHLFTVRVKATSSSGHVFISTDQELQLEGAVGLRIRNVQEPDTEMYVLEVYIDGSLAYAAQHRWIPSEGTLL